MPRSFPILSLALLSATPAFAEVAQPGYFQGFFTRVGRSAEKPATLINDIVQMRLVEGGLALSQCLPDGSEGKQEVIFAVRPEGEITKELTGKTTEYEISCRYADDGYGYPIFNCFTSEGVIFTLWPLEYNETCPVAE